MPYAVVPVQAQKRWRIRRATRAVRHRPSVARHFQQAQLTLAARACAATMRRCAHAYTRAPAPPVPGLPPPAVS